VARARRTHALDEQEAVLSSTSDSQIFDLYENAGGLATSLTADEGDALAMLDALLGFVRADEVHDAVDIGTPRPEFLRLAARHIAVGVARWLAEEGGYRERSVLRAGRRVSGRVWDERLLGDWAPMFSKSFIDFWLGAARILPPFDAAECMAIGRDGTVRRSVPRRLLGGLVVRDCGGDGDWVFYCMAQRAIREFALEPQDEKQVLRALRKASPLAELFALDLQEDRDDIAVERVSRLFAPGTVRILECAQDRLARAWEHALCSLWNRHDVVGDLMPMWTAVNRALGAYVTAADAARRCDLLRPLLRTLAMIPRKMIVGGGMAARAHLSALAGLTSIQQRDAMLATVRAVTALGVTMNRLREQFVLERYGDDRYEEGQLFLQAFFEEFAEARADLDDISRALSNSVG
jgi:hypothetical protein